MKLLIDIGNTSAKLAVASADKIVHFERLEGTWQETFTQLRDKFDITSVRISTVAGDDPELKEALAQWDVEVLWLTAQVPCPIKSIKNVHPQLGADRWAADIGALSMDPNHTLLIIDAGTCLTYDAISRDGTVLGGAISPGVQLRLNAMHEHTALLPQINVKTASERDTEVLANETDTQMFSAAINGTRFEIEGYIRHMLRDYPDLHVFITGGNTFEFAEDITCPITHEPYLVLRGLAAL